MWSAGEYTQAVAQAAEENQDFVMGFISISPAAWKDGPGSPGMLRLVYTRVREAGGCRQRGARCMWEGYRLCVAVCLPFGLCTLCSKGV